MKEIEQIVTNQIWLFNNSARNEKVREIHLACLSGKWELAKKSLAIATGWISTARRFQKDKWIRSRSDKFIVDRVKRRQFVRL